MTKTRFSSILGSATLVFLALVFFAYHFYQTGYGVASFAQAYLLTTPTPTPTPVVHVQTLDDRVVLGQNAKSFLWPTEVVMPTVNIDLPLSGSIEKSGQWDISTIGGDFALNSALPNGVTGNTVLFGHDRAGLFHNIHNLKIGDEVYVESHGKIYDYKVAWTQTVDPSNVSVMDQTRDPLLTLITCDGWLSQQRYVVVARFNKIVE